MMLCLHMRSGRKSDMAITVNLRYTSIDENLEDERFIRK